MAFIPGPPHSHHFSAFADNEDQRIKFKHFSSKGLNEDNTTHELFDELEERFEFHKGIGVPTNILGYSSGNYDKLGTFAYRSWCRFAESAHPVIIVEGYFSRRGQGACIRANRAAMPLLEKMKTAAEELFCDSREWHYPDDGKKYKVKRNRKDANGRTAFPHGGAMGDIERWVGGVGTFHPGHGTGFRRFPARANGYDLTRRMDLIVRSARLAGIDWRDLRLITVSQRFFKEAVSAETSEHTLKPTDFLVLPLSTAKAMDNRVRVSDEISQAVGRLSGIRFGADMNAQPTVWCSLEHSSDLEESIKLEEQFRDLAPQFEELAAEYMDKTPFMCVQEYEFEGRYFYARFLTQQVPFRNAGAMNAGAIRRNAPLTWTPRLGPGMSKYEEAMKRTMEHPRPPHMDFLLRVWETHGSAACTVDDLETQWLLTAGCSAHPFEVEKFTDLATDGSTFCIMTPMLDFKIRSSKGTRFVLYTVGVVVSATTWVAQRRVARALTPAVPPYIFSFSRSTVMCGLCRRKRSPCSWSPCPSRQRRTPIAKLRSGGQNECGLVLRSCPR